MRNFFIYSKKKRDTTNLSKKRIFQNLVGIYLCFLIMFTYLSLNGSIPNHIYVNEGEKLEYQLPVPITFQKTDSQNCKYICKLFGVIPVKEVEVTAISAQSVFVSGRVIGIYGKTNGVLVLGTSPIKAINGLTYSPSDNKIQSGDYIISLNQIPINKKEELIELINKNGKQQIILGVVRNGSFIEVAITPVPVENEKYMTGIWVKDDMAGIGTMTYYMADYSFGALGHGVGDGETGNLLAMSEGSIFGIELTGMQKGKQGTPGELQGLIYYSKGNHIGDIEKNVDFGLYGKLDEEDFEDFCRTDKVYEIAHKQEIIQDKAYIVSDISGVSKEYEVQITEVNYQENNSNKGITFRVTDPELLELTGGVLRGMSGSPIIENGKIIGAVTHVFVNEPTKGYGIFIDTMLEQKKI